MQSIKEGVYLDRNMRVPQSQQQLFLEEKLLDDSQTLSQCGIEDRSQIIVKGMCMPWRYHYVCMPFWKVVGIRSFDTLHAAIDYYCKS